MILLFDPVPLSNREDLLATSCYSTIRVLELKALIDRSIEMPIDQGRLVKKLINCRLIQGTKLQDRGGE